MNGFLCTIGKRKNIPPTFLRLNDNVTIKQNIKIYRNDISNAEIVTFDDGGKVFGFYENESYCCVFSGYLQYPLPGWTVGKPVDSPEQAALFITNLYSEKGVGFLDGVYGHFVVLILNKNTGEIIVTSDNCGNRRLYYKTTDAGVQLSTHLFAIDQENANPINLKEAAFFLSYEFLSECNTIIPEVKYLDSDKIICFSDKLVLDKKIISPLPRLRLITNEDQAIKQLNKKFNAALERQLPSAGKVAVLLGGFDSALIVASLVNLGKEVETFSFRFEDTTYNQAYVEELSALLGCKHNWVDISSEVIDIGLQQFPLSFNQPSSLAHYLIQTNYLVKGLRQKDIKYCFTGDGCDDIFLGYPTVYKRMKIFNIFGILPTYIVRGIRSLLGTLTVEYLLGYGARLLRNIFLILGRKNPARGFVANRIFDEYSLSNLSQVFTEIDENVLEEKLSAIAKTYSALTNVRLAFKGKGMVGTSRCKIEGASLSNGVVIQSPYNDVEFKNYSTHLDDDLLRPPRKEKNRTIGKYVFVEMVRKYQLLPEEMIFQKKASPVTSPVDSWYTRQMRGTVLQLIKEAPFEINVGYLLKIMRPKLVDKYFRKNTLGRYLFQPISLIVTYAGYFSRKT